jgi:hypothetical protein
MSDSFITVVVNGSKEAQNGVLSFICLLSKAMPKEKSDSVHLKEVLTDAEMYGSPVPPETYLTGKNRLSLAMSSH